MKIAEGFKVRWIEIKVLCIRIALKGIAFLPLPVLQTFGQSLGYLSWIFQSRMAKVTAENIALCFSDLNDSQQAQLTRWSLQETGKTLIESAFAWASTTERCLDSIHLVEGKELVDQLRKDEKGLVFIIPHLGNWEILNHYLGRHYGLTHMYLPNKSAVLEAYIQTERTKTGTRFVRADRKGIKAQLKALKNGGAIGAMPDQEPDVHTGIFARFFEQDALTSELVPGLLDKTNAHCVLAFCRRRQDSGGFDIILRQLDIEKGNPGTNRPDTNGPGEVHPASGAQQINNAIEYAVRQVPEQYLWSYKRFRTRKPGDAELYQFPDNRIRSSIEKLFITLFLRITAALSEQTISRIAHPLASALYWSNFNRSKITSRNLEVCSSSIQSEMEDKLKKCSLLALTETVLETGSIWQCDNQRFEEMLVSDIGKEHLENGVTIVLTPPMGNREVVMRYLGQHFRTMEYYHPNTRRSLNELIVKQRTAMGIALVPHTKEGLISIGNKLASGGIISICPDQQPRVRGGEFAPFFGVEALTTSVIPELLKQRQIRFVFGVAIRGPRGFNLHFEPCYLDPELSSSDILASLNRQMEIIIRADPAQYRWSDKRFNIRPVGEKKLYRF